MNKIIDRIAEELNAPKWWLEGLAIEYLPCRRFGVGDHIWAFDFNQITADQLRDIARQYRVVQYGWLVHNVRPEVFSARMLHKLISPVSLNLADNVTDIFPEGLVSEFYFPFHNNPIDVWDPKLAFDTCCQVYDDDSKVYQWKVAEFITVEGRNYGKWISDVLDLEPLDQLHDAYTGIAGQKVPKGAPEFKAYVNRIEEFYKWVDQLRRPIFAQLEGLHQQWKKSELNSKKISFQEPPILSHFEKYKVEDGKIYTSSAMAPVFFRACVQHCRRSLDDIDTEKPDIHKLDRLYQERVEAVICATACLEAFVNTLGFERFDDLWQSLEKLSLEGKIQILFYLSGKGTAFNTSIEPYQTLTSLVRRRNTLIHFKPRYEKTVYLGSSPATSLHNTLNPQFIDKLPERVKQLIEVTCSVCEFQVPPWIYKQTEWDV